MNIRSFLWRLALAVGVIVMAVVVSAPSYGAEGRFERTLNVTGPVDLDVQTGSGNITVHTGSGSTVHVVGTIHASEMGNWFSGDRLSPDERVKQLESNPPIEQNGNSIRLGHIENRDLRNVSISFDVTVPAQATLHSETGSGEQEITGVKGSVTSHSGSGNLSITDATAGVSARTGSGSISLQNVAGDVRAQAGSGNVRVQMTGQGSVDAETGSGRIELSGVKGRLHAETGSGHIVADGAPTGDWTLDTGSGSVTVRLPADAGFDFYAHTGSGHIDMAHEMTVEGRLSRNEIRGRVHGGGHLVEIKTGSGSIEVQ